MPLRAQLDGCSLNAALLSETQWQALKGSRQLLMPCCDAPAYRRTSRLGTRYFAHSPGSHCGAEGESAEHLAAKAKTVRVCDELGWDALSEFAGDNWRADVYAMRGRHRVAFEIQWSRQSLEGTRERHAAYGPDVKCYWLFRKLPSPIGQRADPDQLERLTAERDLPIFRLSLADSGFNVIVDHKTLSLRDFVAARLERRIRFCEQRNYTVSQVQLVVCTVECWKPSCRSRYEVFYTRRILRSDCGAEHVEREPGEVDILAQNPHSALRNWRVVKELFATEAKDL